MNGLCLLRQGVLSGSLFLPLTVLKGHHHRDRWSAYPEASQRPIGPAEPGP